MTWIKNLKTMTKVLLGFGLMAALVGFVGYQGLRGMQVIADQLDSLVDRDALGLSLVKGANLNLILMMQSLSDAILAHDAADIERLVGNNKKYTANFRKEFEEYQKRLIIAEAKAKASEVEKIFNDFQQEKEKIIELVKANKDDEAMQGLKKVRSMTDVVDAELLELAKIKEAVMQQTAKEAAALYASTRTFIIVVIAAAIGVAVAIGYFIARLISRPLGQAVGVLQTVAAGDFTTRLDVNTKDEVGQMALALNQAVDSVRTVLQEVKLSADSVATASQQLSASAEQLSSGSQEQASSLEETAASLEEITGTVRQNADNAKQANQLAVSSRDTADKGGQVVTAAVGAMSEINQSSKKIADIITTIDEIAFQTNLLALNAAVEAARAGEQGRGFAVVAAEVRNLAQRSATAAKEIKALIQDSVQKVEMGSELVNKSGQTLEEIVVSVKRVADIIAEITAASQEQSQGIDQVNKAVTQMDQVVQASAAQAEELSSTAESLATQAEQLQALVGRFKLDHGQPVVAAHTPVAVSATPKAVATPAKITAAPKSMPKKAEPVRVGAPSGNSSAYSPEDGFEEF